ncbi:MAG TPA: GDP-mannose 4,6-dehydratase [Acidobacteriota bacterium]|nr:GDP-mannose 4,6-dehydratase [Acidobacteriota bacterium]
MRILVTGGCGFLGSHFVRARLRQHSQDTIVNADYLTYAGSLDNLEEAADNPRHHHVLVDVSNTAALEPLWDDRFDLIVHFAAETHVDRSLENAGAFVRTNVVGTQSLLAAVQRHRSDGPDPVIVIVSTDEVYGPTPEGQTFLPDQPLAPTSPYAASKAAADMIALAYAASLDLDITVVRSVNVYGARQYPEKLIPLFVARGLAGENLPLYGDGRQRRSWLYVDDFVDGLSTICTDDGKRRTQSIWHLGSAEETENISLAEQICDLCEIDRGLIQFVSDRPGHDRRYALDYSETAATFDWQPRTQLSDGLSRTVAWIRGNREWARGRLGWMPIFLRGDRT